MIEYDKKFLPSYLIHRPNSFYEINDARHVDYNGLFKKYNFPQNIDYLQIDLEVGNSSTLDTLKILDNTIFDEYRFAVVTFEHDIYANTSRHHKCRDESRKIFEKRGYVRVFSDVQNGYGVNRNVDSGGFNIHTLKKIVNINSEFVPNESLSYFPFEDWYLHPNLVNMNYINKIKSEYSQCCFDIIKTL